VRAGMPSLDAAAKYSNRSFRKRRGVAVDARRPMGNADNGDDTHPVHAGGWKGALLIHSHQGGRCRGVVPAEGVRRRCCSGRSPEGSAC